MSAKGEKAAITITTIILSILAVLSVFVIAAWAVVSLADLGPENTAQAYVSTVTTADGSERYFMELEYWENADGKGKEVFEFTFNGYTDWQQQAVLGKGVQYVANEGASGLPSILSGGNWSQVYYDYDERYNTAWASLEGEEVDFGDGLYVGIGDETYMLKMEGKWYEPVETFNLTKSIGSVFRNLFTDWDGFSRRESWYDTKIIEHSYTMQDFYADILNSMVQNTTGYGSMVCNLVDLAKYFNLYKLDESNNPVLVTDATDNSIFFAVKVTRHFEGFRRAGDSNFGMLLGDRYFTTVDSDNYFNDYSDTEVLPTLTGRDFDYYTIGTGGYIAFVKQSVVDELTAAGVTEVAVDINANDSYFIGNTDFVAVQASSFGGLRLKALRIGLYQSAEEITFTIYEASSFERLTGLALDDIEISAAGKYTENVNVVHSDFWFIKEEAA